MVDLSSNTFKLILNGVNLEALETSHFLDIAIQLIQGRKFELERLNPTLLPQVQGKPTVEKSTPSDQTGPGQFNRSSQGRWFRDRFLQIQFKNGNITTLRSIDELRTFIEERGLTPHPRGDASMLIWQVRNRLGFKADAIAPDNN